MFIKTAFKDSKKVKDYVLKYYLYPYFLIKQKLLISREKNVVVSRTQGVFHVIYIFFDLL